MATRLIPVLYQAVDANGNPADGYKLYFYETGTTNLKDTYSDTALSVVNANPVICNSDGRPANGAGAPIDIFGVSKEDYKVILTTDADVTVVTDDPIDTITYDINSFSTRPAQHWGTTTGTADAFQIKPVPSITAYTSDLLFTIQMSLDNNAGSTIAVFQEGTVSTYLVALDMKKYDNAGAKVDLEAGDNQAGQTYLYRIDGTDAVCLNPGIPYLNLKNSSLSAGIVIGFASDVVPTGWLECDGATISRTTYATLFAAIGTVYGIGNGTTTFEIPDLRGQFIRGFDNGAGTDPDAATRTDSGDGSTTGDNVGTKQADAFQGHKHTYVFGGTAGGTSDSVTQGNNTTAALNSFSIVTDGVNGTPRITSETRPTNVYLMHCIKY